MKLKEIRALTDRDKRERALLRKYWFFSDYTRSPQETNMCFGLEVGEGWLDLIEDLCERINAYINCCEPEMKSGEYPFRVTQVKEKFGALRFYVSGGNEDIFVMISEAEDESIHICEKCGRPGKTRNNLGWMLTLCNKHYKEREDEIKKRDKKARASSKAR